MSDLTIRKVKISSLTPDPQNARTHDVKNLTAIRNSLDAFGQRKPIIVAKANDGSLVVVAGNGTLEAAKQLGWTDIAVAQVPDDWDADKARAYAIADNRTAELADWDKDQLAATLVDLDAVGWSMSQLGFLPGDLEYTADQFDTDDLSDGSIYTQDINIPQYQIVGERPTVDELTDETKADQLRVEIMSADVPEDVRDFLLAAANRHVVFNYRKIAEFYPHASADVQRLMEASALVIIDLDNAIRNGFANFTSRVNELEKESAANG